MCCDVLCRAVLCWPCLCCAVLAFPVLYCVVLCCAMLHCAMSCFAVPCCVVLCRAVKLGAKACAAAFTESCSATCWPHQAHPRPYEQMTSARCLVCLSGQFVLCMCMHLLQYNLCTAELGPHVCRVHGNTMSLPVMCLNCCTGLQHNAFNATLFVSLISSIYCGLSPQNKAQATPSSLYIPCAA